MTLAFLKKSVFFFSNTVFILSSLSKSDLLFSVSGKTSGLCGLNVVTYGIKLLSCLVFLVFNKSFQFNAFTFLCYLQRVPGDTFASIKKVQKRNYQRRCNQKEIPTPKTEVGKLN